MGRVADLGTFPCRTYGGVHLGQEVPVVVPEAQIGPVVGAVDQYGVVASHRIGPVGVEVAGDGGGAGLVAHPVAQVVRQEFPDPGDGTLVAESEEGRPFDQGAQTRRESVTAVALAVEHVVADREDGQRRGDPAQDVVRDVPLPAAVAVGRGVGEEEPAAADDHPATGVELLQDRLVHQPVHGLLVPAARTGVGVEAHADGFGQHLVARVLLAVGEQRDVRELFGGVGGRGDGRGRAALRGTHVPGTAVGVGGVGVQAVAGVAVCVPRPAEQPGQPGQLPVRAGGEVR